VNWSEPRYVTTTVAGIGSGYMRNAIVAPPVTATISKVYVVTTCNYQAGCTDQLGITLRTYSDNGEFEIAELIYNGPVDAGSVFLSSSRFGAYAYWPGSLRRKPFAVGGTIAERTLLTGKNWFTGAYGFIQNGFTVTALTTPATRSETILLNGALLSVQGLLEFTAGSVVKFGVGSIIFVYGDAFGNRGKVVAQGTANQRVTFEGTGSTPQSNGLSFVNAGNFSDLNYCNFNNLSTAIWVENSWLNISNTVIVGCVTGIDIRDAALADIHVSNSRIAGCSVGYINPAVRIWYGDNVKFDTDTIQGNSHVGIEIQVGSPRFYNTIVAGNGFWGADIFNLADPRFGDMDYGAPGRNRFEGNTVFEVAISHDSHPFFGFVESENPLLVQGGYNSILTNNQYFMSVRRNSGSYAQWNFWARGGLQVVCPDNSDFQIAEESWISPKPCLGGPPGLLSQEETLLRTAQHERGLRNFNRAVSIYAGLIASRPNAPASKIALFQLNSTYLDMIRATGDSSKYQLVDQYLRNQITNHPNNVLKILARRLRARSVETRGDYATAKYEYEQILRSNVSADDRLASLFGLFTIHAARWDDLQQGSSYLAEMRRLDSNHRLTRAASEWFTVIQRQPRRHGLNRIGQRDNWNATIPTELKLEQNFPNPFNPATTIRYSLPNDGVISLIVYDILGREVATLESGFRVAGSYETVFDASKLASSLYIYRLQAGSVMLSRRMLLLK